MAQGNKGAWEPRCSACGKSLVGVPGKSCPKCGRILSATDFDPNLQTERHDARRRENQGTIALVFCVIIALAVTAAVAGGGAPPILALPAWALVLAAAGPKVWYATSRRSRSGNYRDSIDDGWN
jgi:hypothetical protein